MAKKKKVKEDQKSPIKKENIRDNKGRFVKGIAPNPKGRPKKEDTYSDTMKELLQGNNIKVSWTINDKVKTLDVSSTKNMYYGIAASQIMEALKGNVAAQKEIVDRVQGKAPQTIINEGTDDTANKFKQIADIMDAVNRDGENTSDNSPTG
jgi:hypothetical protein